jgi:hypothetical protein
MQTILTIAFVFATIAFFKERLKLGDWQALLLAFIVSLIVGLSEVAMTVWPIALPWLQAGINVIVLFLSAAGGYDFMVDVGGKIAARGATIVKK